MHCADAPGADGDPGLHDIQDGAGGCRSCSQQPHAACRRGQSPAVSAERLFAMRTRAGTTCLPCAFLGCAQTAHCTHMLCGQNYVERAGLQQPNTRPSVQAGAGGISHCSQPLHIPLYFMMWHSRCCTTAWLVAHIPSRGLQVPMPSEYPTGRRILLHQTCHARHPKRIIVYLGAACRGRRGVFH